MRCVGYETIEPRVVLTYIHPDTRNHVSESAIVSLITDYPHGMSLKDGTFRPTEQITLQL
jgi:hypothetical protein